MVNNDILNTLDHHELILSHARRDLLPRRHDLSLQLAIGRHHVTLAIVVRIVVRVEDSHFCVRVLLALLVQWHQLVELIRLGWVLSIRMLIRNELLRHNVLVWGGHVRC